MSEKIIQLNEVQSDRQQTRRGGNTAPHSVPRQTVGQRLEPVNGQGHSYKASLPRQHGKQVPEKTAAQVPGNHSDAGKRMAGGGEHP